MKKLWNPIFCKEDIEILLFLWRHRLATFQALKTIFYPTLSNRQAYDKLKRLRQGNYLVLNSLQGTHNRIWQLGKRGQLYVQNELMIESKTKTHNPQSGRHDLIVMAMLLGDWILKTPAGVKMVTEMELMETEIMELPKELREKPDHRCDGLWIVKNGDSHFGIGLEVEINRKSIVRYESISSFYNRHLFFKNVIWIVNSKSHAVAIQEASQKFGNLRPGLHLFILQKDFEQYLWQSKFLNTSMQNLTVSSFLHQQLNPALLSPLRDLSTASLGPLTDHKKAKCNPLLNFELSLSNSESYPFQESHKKL